MSEGTKPPLRSLTLYRVGRDCLSYHHIAAEGLLIAIDIYRATFPEKGEPTFIDKVSTVYLWKENPPPL